MPTASVSASGPDSSMRWSRVFGIGRTPEAMASGEKALSERSVVIELAIVGYPAGAVLVRHRLGTGEGEVDNGKPTMAETEVAVEVESFGIRPTVGQGSGHRTRRSRSTGRSGSA